MTAIPRYLMNHGASRLIRSVNHRTGIVTVYVYPKRKDIGSRVNLCLVVLLAVAAVLGRVL